MRCELCGVPVEDRRCHVRTDQRIDALDKLLRRGVVEIALQIGWSTPVLVYLTDGLLDFFGVPAAGRGGSRQPVVVDLVRPIVAGRCRRPVRTSALLRWHDAVRRRRPRKRRTRTGRGIASAHLPNRTPTLHHFDWRSAVHLRRGASLLLLMQRRREGIELLLQLCHATVRLLLPLPAGLRNDALSPRLRTPLARDLRMLRVLIASHLQPATGLARSRPLCVLPSRPITALGTPSVGVVMHTIIAFWTGLRAGLAAVPVGLLRRLRLLRRGVVVVGLRWQRRRPQARVEDVLLPAAHGLSVGLCDGDRDVGDRCRRVQLP